MHILPKMYNLQNKTEELGMSHDKYVLIDLDNSGKIITAADAAKGLKPFVKE